MRRPAATHAERGQLFGMDGRGMFIEQTLPTDPPRCTCPPTDTRCAHPDCQGCASGPCYTDPKEA